MYTYYKKIENLSMTDKFSPFPYLRSAQQTNFLVLSEVLRMQCVNILLQSETHTHIN